MRQIRIIFKTAIIVCLFNACQSDRNYEDNLRGKLIIFHAGSLSVPLRNISEAFKKIHPEIKLEMEASGSLTCAKKITDLKRECDIMLSADYQVINQFLIPEYADWNIHFATNQLVIAFTEESKYVDLINSENWHTILSKKDVVFGRSDPDTDPCGYRTVMLFELADIYYNEPSSLILLSKDGGFIRPKSADLNALIEVKAVDYIFVYRSVAEQHELSYIVLPDEINLGNPMYNEFYQQAEISVSGKTPDEQIIQKGSAIVYGLTILNKARNYEAALKFVDFLFNEDKGMNILKECGQPGLIPCMTNNFENIPQRLKKYVISYRN